MADYVELQIEAGATFTTEVTVKDNNGNAMNLVNYLARSQLRKSYYSTTKTDFDVTLPDAANGDVKMELTAANTANIRAGRYVYDVEIESPTGTVTRIFEGIVTVLPNVTR